MRSRCIIKTSPFQWLDRRHDRDRRFFNKWRAPSAD
jgi:hypothetical protein